GRGVFECSEEEVALGHVRLAILDLSEAAAQPMHSPDGRFVLTYNGEIYNYHEIAQLLHSKGHVFSSTGDTEVLLRAIIEWGTAAIPKLNGIFAFAVWDRQERELLLVRDPIGVKPLYIVEPSSGT